MADFNRFSDLNMHGNNIRKVVIDHVSALPTTNLYEGRIVNYKGYYWIYTAILTPKGWHRLATEYDVKPKPILTLLSDFSALDPEVRNYQLTQGLTDKIVAGTVTFPTTTIFSQYTLHTAVMDDSATALSDILTNLDTVFHNFLNPKGGVVGYLFAGTMPSKTVVGSTKGRFVMNINVFDNRIKEGGFYGYPQYVEATMSRITVV